MIRIVLSVIHGNGFRLIVVAYPNEIIVGLYGGGAEIWDAALVTRVTIAHVHPAFDKRCFYILMTIVIGISTTDHLTCRVGTTLRIPREGIKQE